MAKWGLGLIHMHWGVTFMRPKGKERLHTAHLAAQSMWTRTHKNQVQDALCKQAAWELPKHVCVCAGVREEVTMPA